MYNLTLTIHSLLRWVVVILAVVTVLRAFIGWLGHRAWTNSDQQLGRFLSISVDVQLLLGLILYFLLSPITKTAVQDFGSAMSNDVTRYWAVEHLAVMIVAVVLVHAGQVLSKRATDASAKHRWAAIFFGLGTLAILAAIPWPFLDYGRPWIRLG